MDASYRTVVKETRTYCSNKLQAGQVGAQVYYCWVREDASGLCIQPPCSLTRSSFLMDFLSFNIIASDNQAVLTTAEK
jgi:hypothetical protein